MKVILNIDSLDVLEEACDTLDKMVESIARTSQCDPVMSVYDSGVTTLGSVSEDGTFTIDAVLVDSCSSPMQ
jgi:hypothetical protein